LISKVEEMIPEDIAKGLAHLMRSVVLAVVMGLEPIAASVSIAADNVQIAAASSSPTSLAQCVRPQALPWAAIVEACNKVLGSKDLIGADRAAALYSRGRAYEVLGDSTRARSDLLGAADQYTALMPLLSPAPALLYARAQVWHSLGEADRAISDYDQVARLVLTEPLVFLNRGILLARYKQQYQLALMDFDQVLALKPKDPEVAYRAAQERAIALAAIGAPRAHESDHEAAGIP
jgi:lipoprotein NlpI